MSLKKRVLSIALVVITIVILVAYDFSPSNKIWGAGGEPYMVIAGKKPLDAKISVSVKYFGRGESCTGWAWRASDGELSTEIYHERFKIDHNFSEDEAYYELRVPYQPRQPVTNCITQLSNMEVKLVNAFDTVGFANLRIHRSVTDYDNKPLDVSSKVEARNCNGHLYEWAKDIWKGTIGCYYLVDGKKLSEGSQTNAETVYFDFSKFNDNTVIHYDILAGDDYRSTPLDPQTGN